MYKLWQKYKCEKRASNIALYYGAVTIHAFDRQTDGQTAFSSLDRVCIPCSVV